MKEYRRNLKANHPRRWEELEEQQKEWSKKYLESEHGKAKKKQWQQNFIEKRRQKNKERGLI